MSVLTGCKTGCENTGLVFEDVRSDAYTLATQMIAGKIPEFECSRKIMKQSIMTAYYGSKATPERNFGKETKELDAFYETMGELAPGASDLLGELIDAWQKYSKVHSWTMPDGFDVKIKVMQAKETRIEVDELDHATFSFMYFENEGSKKGISLPANVIHSYDALVVRTLHRKCNYDPVVVLRAKKSIEEALKMKQTTATGSIVRYKQLYEATGLADVVVLPHLINDATGLSKTHLKKLLELVDSMLEHPPFDLVSIHDAFFSHPKYMNWIRKHYAETLADIAESECLSHLFSQIYNSKVQYKKLSKTIGSTIRNSNYGIC